MAKTKSSAPTVTAQDRYETLKSERQPYEARARAAAELTIPALFPPEGTTGATELPKPWQSIGARGVNHLSAKLLLALFPPNQPFFRLTMEEYVKDELAAQTGEAYGEAQVAFEQALRRVEQTVITRLEHTGARTTLNEVFKQLINAGNALVEVMEDSRIRLHLLTNYVVKRDKAGNVIEIVVLETVSRMALPPEVLPLLEKSDAEQKDESHENNVEIYTRISLVDGAWEVHQEVGGELIPGSEGTYPKDKSPWMPLRFIKVDGEDYGRGMVDEYLGDLKTLEALQKAIVQFAGAAAKIIVFVDDTGLTDGNEVADADSGDVLDGRAEDVSAFQLDKYYDFRVAKEVLDDTRARLEEAFLLFSGMRRDAERVTAEEIRAIINELEQGLGGIYSILTQELQAPLVRRVIHQMVKEKALPQLPDEAIAPQIITGVQALGRQSEAVRLQRWLIGVAETFGPEVVAKHVRVDGFLRLKAIADGIDPEVVLRDAKEVAQMEEAQAQQAALQKLGPQAMKLGAEQGGGQSGA